MITSAKAVAGSTADPALQNMVIGSAKMTALSASQLIATAKVLATVINTPACQDQLIEATMYVAASVEDLASSCQAACANSALLKKLGDEAQQVSKSIEALVAAIQQQQQANKLEDECEIILQAADAVQSSIGNVSEMLRQAKNLVMRTDALVSEVQAEVNVETNKDKKAKLSKALQGLTSALNTSVECAKAVARQTTDPAVQITLASSMEGLRQAVEVASSGAVHRKLVHKLAVDAKQSCAVHTQLLSAVHGVKGSDESLLLQLRQQSKTTAETITSVIAACKAFALHRDNPGAKLELINVCKV
jgi:hypothetical protein